MAARQPAEAGAILVPSTSGWAQRTEVMADMAVEDVEAVEDVAEAETPVPLHTRSMAGIRRKAEGEENIEARFTNANTNVIKS